MDSTDATTLVSVVKDAMVRMNLPMSKLRGQCYDGASVMSGIRMVLPNKWQTLNQEQFSLIATVMH